MKKTEIHKAIEELKQMSHSKLAPAYIQMLEEKLNKGEYEND